MNFSGRRSCSYWRWIFALVCISAHVNAQFNSWTNPTSGNWDNAANWSAGLPNSSQSEVLITNANSKAVAIQPTTPTAFPGSMTVQNLRLTGVPPDTNVLLMNFFGTTTPLRVLNDFNIEPNGRVQMLQSGLNVGNALNLKAVFDQEGGQLLFTNSFTNTMQIEGGRFNLTNGLVAGNNMYLGGTNDGYVTQASGLVSLNWLLLGSKPSVPGSTGAGTYRLQSGWLIVNTFEGVGFTGFGTLIQSGGTNSASDLAVSIGDYLKTGGGLFAGEVRVLGVTEPIFAPPHGVMTHAGGTATITNVLRLVGQGSHSNPRPATFNMLGGTLSTPRIQLEAVGNFVQSNGTVNVSSELFSESNGSVPNYYHLYGGNVFAANTTISSFYPEPSSFIQRGGTHVVTNTLRISGSSIYQLSGGTVTASNIVLTGNINNPPQFRVVNGFAFAVTNQTISMIGGMIVIDNSHQHLGRLTITSDSGVTLAGGSAILRFADSRTNSWASELFGVVPRLFVHNWAGSTNGGGTDQLIFGTNSSSLTKTQLAQILFVNPTGFPSGTNHARILSTGEVVPMVAPTLDAQRNGTNLVITWSGNFILQSATNVAGPYLDVTNAMSPYTNSLKAFPQQFFRLRD